MKHAAPDIIIHIPHASKSLKRPVFFPWPFLQTVPEVHAEVHRITDGHTDDLFRLKMPAVTRIVFARSRVLVDVERFEDDRQEPMAAVGRGRFYTKDSFGRPLRATPTGEWHDYLHMLYQGHHSGLADRANEAIANRKRCLVIDAHSFPDEPLPFEPDQKRPRPDICIGTDDACTPSWLSDLAKNLFEPRFVTTFNTPYSGTIMPHVQTRPDEHLHSIMIEINRKLYMDERTGKRLKGYKAFKEEFQTRLKTLIKGWRAHMRGSSPAKRRRTR